MTKSNKIKHIIVVLSLTMIVVMLSSVMYSLSKINTVRKLAITDYVIADIDFSNGNIIESNEHIVTKNLLSVKDMSIKLKDGATVSYSVVFYDADKNYLSHEENITTDYSGDVSGYEYFRVVITPRIVDNEPVQLNLINMNKYINQVEISYSK